MHKVDAHSGNPTFEGTAGGCVSVHCPDSRAALLLHLHTVGWGGAPGVINTLIIFAGVSVDFVNLRP